jgi:hypothetical protein
MTEDKKIAAKLVEQEIKQVAGDMKKLEVPADVISFENLSNWPAGDGEGSFMPITIGVRGKLTKREARHAAMMWREVTRRYPKGIFMINLLGYNEDPREIWNIPEAARYVRWWARFADMNDLKTAERYVLDAPDIGVTSLNIKSIAESNVAFLAACGVFGDEMKTSVLRNHKPPIVAL